MENGILSNTGGRGGGVEEDLKKVPMQYKQWEEAKKHVYIFFLKGRKVLMEDLWSFIEITSKSEQVGIFPHYMLV